MTLITLTVRLEDSGSGVEPIVNGGWQYRCRNSLPYVNASNEKVDNEWDPTGGWKDFNGVSVTLDLDPLPPENPYLLEIKKPQFGKPPVVEREWRQVLSSTPANTSWWVLNKVSEPGSTGATDPEALRAYVDAQFASIQAQIAALAVGGDASTVDTLPGMSDNARSFNKAANYLAMRNLLLAAGLTTVDDLAVNDDATITGDLTVSGAVSIPDNALAQAKVAGLVSALTAAVAAATATAQGQVELATNAEAVAGTDTVRAVTPAGLAAAIAATIPTVATDPLDPDILIVTVP